MRKLTVLLATVFLLMLAPPLLPALQLDIALLLLLFER